MVAGLDPCPAAEGPAALVSSCNTRNNPSRSGPNSRRSRKRRRASMEGHGPVDGCAGSLSRARKRFCAASHSAVTWVEEVLALQASRNPSRSAFAFTVKNPAVTASPSTHTTIGYFERPLRSVDDHMLPNTTWPGLNQRKV